MEIAWFRDLTIVILGVVAIIAIIFLAVVVYVIYKKIKRILDSAESVSVSAKGIVADVKESIDSIKEEAMSPMIQLMSIVQGVRQGMDVFNKFFKKDEGGSHDK